MLDSFEERLRWARERANLSQIKLREKMAEMFGVSIGNNYISMLELGRDKKPSFEVVRAMAGALNVSLDWLALFTEDPTLASEREPTPVYFSEEADQIARLVDAMSPEQRAFILSIAANLAPPPNKRNQRLNEAQSVLESIETELGREARISVERIMREKGLLPRPASRHNFNP